MISAFLLVLVCPSAAYSLQQQQGVTPIQKVVQMMQDMLAKGKQEKHEESVAFTTYTEWCKNTMDFKQKAIADGDAAITTLSADIQKAESDATVLGKKIAELNSEVDAWEADLSKATELRKGERADYQATHNDYSESVDALDRAIVILKRKSADTTQLMQKDKAFLQKVAQLNRIPAAARRTITSFLATDQEIMQDPLSVSAPQANAYEFQSGGVVEMFEKLKDKFQDERNTLEKDELNAKHAFTMQAQELHDQMDAAKKEISMKEKAKAGREQDAAEAKGDLADTTATKEEDTTYLNALVAQCDQKSKDYENRQTLRSEELEAITKAIEIIQSPSVSGAGETYLPQLIQKSASTKHAFSLLRSDAVRPIQKNVAVFLADRARTLESRVLSAVATKVRDGPFDKVKKMVKDLIVRLMEEATQESEHKGWCDTELGTNKQTREDKSEDVDMLVAKKDQLTADIAKLSDQIAGISDDIAEIDAAVAEATKVRGEEKAKNTQTVADAQEAQTAVAAAIEVLSQFYAKAAEATSLVQVNHKSKQSPDLDAPATFDKPYNGMGGENGGVQGMLEVIQSDFARLEAETRASESEGSDQFQKFSDESAKDKAVKSTDMDHKEKTKTEKESDLNDCTKDLAATQNELDAALAYYDKLKPACVDAGLSYEERVKQREEEIQSLKEALRILEGEDIA
jgi:hypothetical protein